MSTPLPPGFTASPEEPRPAALRLKPGPVGPAVVVHHHGVPAWFLVVLVVAIVFVVAAWRFVAFDVVPGPPDVPPSEGVRVGRTLVPALAEALAKGFDAAAERIDNGQTIRAADDVLKATFDRERNAAFAQLGGPYLANIVPAGTEPKDNVNRSAFAQAHRAIASGLRGAR